MSEYAVVMPDKATNTVWAVACRHPAGVAWVPPAEAWRAISTVLTWETRYGAEQFAAMNGGIVTPFTEVFDASVILPTHGPLQHSPDQSGPLEGSSAGQRQEIDDHEAQARDGRNYIHTHHSAVDSLDRDSCDSVQQVERPVMRPLEPCSRLLLVWLAVILLLSLTALGGCAALPMPLQPQTEQNSNLAEGAFLVLASVDTVQTMHIRQGTSCDHEADPIAVGIYGSPHPKPARVLLTNLALMTVHTMVASWLDDKVADAKGDSVGPWYTTRLLFHTVSLLAEGSAVVNNASRGCKL